MIANYRTSGAGRDPYLRQEGGRPSRERNEKRKSYEIANELYCGARAAVRLRILKCDGFFFSFSIDLANLTEGENSIETSVRILSICSSPCLFPGIRQLVQSSSFIFEP